MAASDTSGFNLDAVRARAAELRASLLEVVGTLSDAPHLLQWDSVLKKYSTINVQVMSLREQLRAVLRQVVVHPKMVTDPNLAQALPLQLASSELPEMQAADAELVASEDARLAEAGIPPTDRFEAADSQIEDYNNLLTHLTSGPEAMLGAKSLPRVEMAQRSRKITKTAAASREVALSAVAGSRTAEGAAGAAGAVRAGMSNTARAAAGAKKQKIEAAGQKSGAVPPKQLDPTLALLLSGEGARVAKR